MPTGAIPILCQTPVIYRRGGQAAARSICTDSRSGEFHGARLDRATTQLLFARSGDVKVIEVTVPGDQLLAVAR